MLNCLAMGRGPSSGSRMAFRGPGRHPEVDMRTLVLYLGLGSLLLLAAAGCLFSPDEPDDPPDGGDPTELPFPDSKEQLLANFQRAYELMDINVYGPMLHDDYKFFLQEDDIEGLGLPFDHFNRDDDIDLMENIFSGNPHLRDDGEVSAAVTEITFSTLDQNSVWEPSTHPDFPGAERALYLVDISFLRPADTTILVNGRTEFYLVSRDSMNNGVPTPYWQVMGQVDQTNSTGKNLP